MKVAFDYETLRPRYAFEGELFVYTHQRVGSMTYDLKSLAKLYKPLYAFEGELKVSTLCRLCEGTGHIDTDWDYENAALNSVCWPCHGKGVVVR